MNDRYPFPHCMYHIAILLTHNVPLPSSLTHAHWQHVTDVKHEVTQAETQLKIASKNRLCTTKDQPLSLLGGYGMRADDKS